MNRIFFRFFLLVMLTITLASFVVYFAASRLFGDPLDEIAARQASAEIFLLEKYVDQAPPDEWLSRLNKVREITKVQLDLEPLASARAAVPASSRAALERGEVVLDVPNKAFYRRVDLAGDKYVGSADEVIHASRLPIDVGLALKMEVLRFVIVALALLVPIALWSRSHWQGLQSLARVADEFGAGQLSARAQMARSASMYPLAERINAMAARIEHLLAAQRNLLHAVSHELRTPIARLEFALELLRAAAREPALEARIDAMEGDLAELDALVNELLSMARQAHQAPAEHAPLALAPLLRDCVDTLPEHQARVRLELQLPAEPGLVEGDARLLARALGNLLRNAGKYAEQEIVLSAQVRGGSVEIAVEDDGPGIPKAERDRIFEPFYRLDRSRDRATGGFGLGLSIAEQAVKLHGGTIRVEDGALGGARFVITLPQRSPAR